MIGSNIAEQLVEQGDTVRALVREGSDTGPLEAFGVEIVRGDITDADAVLAAADGCEYVIHSAAVLGGQTQVAGEHEAVNVVGTGLRARRRGQGRRHPGGAAQHHHLLRRPDVRRSPSTRRSTRPERRSRTRSPSAPPTSTPCAGSTTARTSAS